MEKKVISELKNDMKTVKAKKSSLVSGNQSGENLFIIYPSAQFNMYQNIFCFKKTYKLKEEKRKTKENKEGKGKENAAVANSICGGSNKIHQ